MDSKKFVMSYSGGKDCMLAMYRKIKEGWTPVALITTVKKDSVDSWTHSISKKLLEKATNAGLDYELPLWQGDREKVVHEFIDAGFKAVIKKVNLENMSEDFLGKTLDKPLIEEIKKTGSDACGEHGEYHTFVVDGPLFSTPIELDVLGKTISNGYGILDVK